jgi:hypothetical protein
MRPRRIREAQVELPHRSVLVEQFAKHMAADAKVLQEDEETGVKKYRYVRTGEDHFSLAFTYAWMAGGDPPLNLDTGIAWPRRRDDWFDDPLLWTCR